MVVAGSTYMPGNTAQLSGAPLSVAPDHVVLGGSTYGLPAPAAVTPVLVGGQSIVKAPGGGVVVGDSTVPSGGQATIAGQVIQVGPSNAVVGGSTYNLPAGAGGVVQAPAPTPVPAAPVLVAGQSVVRAPDGGLVVGGSTVPPGAQATIAGHVISAGPSMAGIDGTNYALPTNPGAVLQQAPNLAQDVAAHSILTLANGAVITAGGPPATVDGTVIAIPSGDNGIIVNGQTVPLNALPLPTAAPSSVFTVGGQTFTAAPTGFSVGSQSLSPGGSAITLSGTVLSLGPSGALQIGSSTISLPSAIPSVFTVAGQTFTAAPTGFAIGSQTLTPGGSAITLSGTVISLGPSGLQIGTSTIPLPSAPPSVFTVARQVFTASPTSFTIGSQTLTSGGSAITLGGTVISLGPSGLVIGTSTIPLTPAEQTADAAGLGSLILGGFGASPTATGAVGGGSNSSNLASFRGTGSRLDMHLYMTMGIGVGSLFVLMILL